LVSEVLDVRMKVLHAVDGDEVSAISVVVVPIHAPICDGIGHDRGVVVLDGKAVGGHHVDVVLKAECTGVVFDTRDAVLGRAAGRGKTLVVELDMLIGFGPYNLEGVATAVSGRRNTPVGHVDEANHQGILVGEEIALRGVIAAGKV